MICRRCGVPMSDDNDVIRWFPVEYVLEVCSQCFGNWRSKVKVEWVTRETSWERPDDLVRLPEHRMSFAKELLAVARELLS